MSLSCPVMQAFLSSCPLALVNWAGVTETSGGQRRDTDLGVGTSRGSRGPRGFLSRAGLMGWASSLAPPCRLQHLVLSSWSGAGTGRTEPSIPPPIRP